MCIIFRLNASLQLADHPALVEICIYRGVFYCVLRIPIPHTQTRFQHQAASSSRKVQLTQICSNASLAATLTSARVLFLGISHSTQKREKQSSNPTAVSISFPTKSTW